MKTPKKPNKPSEMREAVFFYWENGRRRDANLHNPILEQGDLAAARKVSRKYAKKAGLTDAQIDALYEEESLMPYSMKERQRILLRAKRALGKVGKSASDKRIFIDQCVDSMTSSGDADDEDEARDICLLLWEEGEEYADYE